jgi:two-component system NtrC family sensor kinase
MKKIMAVPDKLNGKRVIEPHSKRRSKRTRIPIATRLILSYLSIIILISAIFTIVGIRLISDRIVAEAQEMVNGDLNSAREIYQSKLQHIYDVIRLTADRFFITDALVSGNIASAEPELEKVKTEESLDILTLTDATGKILFRASNPGYTAGEKEYDEFISAAIGRKAPVMGTAIISGEELQKESPALEAQAYIHFIDTPKARVRKDVEESAGMMLKAAAPIFDDKNNLIGVLYGGVLLNRNYEIVDEIKQTVFENVQYKGKDIGTATIFQNDVRISTNVLNEDGTRAIGTRVSEEVYNRVALEGENWIGRAYVVNNWYITAYEPIRDIHYNIIGILYVGILEQKYLDIQNQTVTAFLAITIIGAIISMLLAYWISQKISVPLKELVAASKQVANGNLDAKVELTTNDELQYLVESFNAMSEALKRRDEQIKDFATKKIMEAERLALIGQLSANVAHELNNPLQGIVTFSHLLLEDQECNDPERMDALEKIVGQADRCREIIRGLLDFARQRKPDKTYCNINTLLENCVSLLEKQALFHNIKIVRNLQVDLPMTVLDPSQIERVFINLIVNAAEAMDGNGQLTLITFFNAKDKTFEIDIKDTGCGIREEDMEKLFDPFFTTKEVGHGTGLGLAISYGIVKSHKGNLLVKSKVGKGTTFTVVLPIAAVEESEGNGHHP